MFLRLSGFTILTLVVGCAPSRQSKTAGSIGCPPSEIEISDEDSSTGWGSASETWMATCRGRKFVCSENTVTTGNGRGLTGISQGLACSEELSEGSDTSNAESGSRRPGNAAAAGGEGKAKGQSADPPKAVAGFEFGIELAAVQKLCEGAGKAWKSSTAKVGICSGAAVDVGFEAKVRADFCQDRSCAFTLVYQPETGWISAFSGLKGKLTEKYGAPATIYAAIPDECRQEAQFQQCLEDGSLRLKFHWQWPAKQKIELSIGKPESGEGPVAIRVKYLNPLNSVHPNADAL